MLSIHEIRHLSPNDVTFQYSMDPIKGMNQDQGDVFPIPGLKASVHATRACGPKDLHTGGLDSRMRNMDSWFDVCKCLKWMVRSVEPSHKVVNDRNG